MDRFHLVMDVIDRVAGPRPRPRRAAPATWSTPAAGPRPHRGAARHRRADLPAASPVVADGGARSRWGPLRSLTSSDGQELDPPEGRAVRRRRRRAGDDRLDLKPGGCAASLRAARAGRRRGPGCGTPARPQPGVRPCPGRSAAWAGVAEARHPRSMSVHHQVEAVEVVEHDHVERRGGGALLLVAAHVQVVVVGAPVGEPVDQPRVAVVGEDDRPVGGEERVELARRAGRAGARLAAAAASGRPR